MTYIDILYIPLIPAEIWHFLKIRTVQHVMAVHNQLYSTLIFWAILAGHGQPSAKDCQATSGRFPPGKLHFFKGDIRKIGLKNQTHPSIISCHIISSWWYLMMYPTKFHKLSTFFDVFCRFSHNPMGQRGSLFVAQPLFSFSSQVAIKLLATFRKSYEVLYQSVLDRVQKSWVNLWWNYGLIYG